MTRESAIQKIVDVCRRLDQKGFVANHDGNVTFKLSENLILATPTGFSKADVRLEDILLVDFKGQVVEGRHKVFSEIAWHLAIYDIRPDIQCIVHAHPPVASGLALAGKAIGTPSVPEAIVSLGRSIELSRFLKPSGDPNLQSEMSRCLGQSDAVIAPGNGVWTVGSEPLQTYLRLELVEQIARMHAVAALFGGVQPLEPQLVEELLKKRPSPKSGSPLVGLPPVEPKEAASSISQSVRAVILEELMQVLDEPR